MDINDVRILITVVSFATFIGIVIWAWSSRQQRDFDAAARLPFADSDLPVPAKKSDASRRNPTHGARI